MTLKKEILKLTEGVVSKTTDLILVSLFYGFEFGFGGYSNTGKASERATDDLSGFNYSHLKRTLSYLKKKGLIQLAREKTLGAFITDAGKKRLNSILPVYYERRVWDHRIYLITYDLPREKNLKRNKFRTLLKKIGGGMLQESVWLTPYNPKEIVNEFIRSNNLEDELIIISTLGKDGTVGDRDISEILYEVYHLSEINERYTRFIDECKKGRADFKELAFFFLSITRDDPQIPFQLLPEEWVGDQAYELFKKLTK